MSNEITILNQIVESEKSSDIKIQELKTFLHKYKQVAKPKIDWKLVAGHLDMSIFEPNNAYEISFVSKDGSNYVEQQEKFRFRVDP